MSYVPIYSEVKEEIVSVTLNLSNYVTQKEFENATKVNTSDFALETNVAEIKKKVDDIDVDKINSIDELQGKKLFEQNYWLLKSAYKYFKTLTDSTEDIDYAYYWQSDGLMNSKMNAIGTDTNNDREPIINYNNKIELHFRKNKVLKQSIGDDHKKIVNIYIVYKIDPNYATHTRFLLKDFLFATINVTPNTDIRKYKYSGGYGFAFKKNRPSLRPSDEKYALNLIIFGCDTSDSKNHILVLGKESIQINETTIKEEKMYPTNFISTGSNNKKVVLSQHYNGDDSYLFVNSVQYAKFKTANTEILSNPICLRNFSEDPIPTGLNGFVYDSSVNYKTISTDEIQKIHKYLMKKHNI